MKKKLIRTYLTALAAGTALLSGCAGGIGASPAEDTATDFLNAYLAADFTKAASFCTDKLSGELKEAVTEVEQLDETIKQHIRNSTGKFTPQIDQTHKSESGDTVIVNYSILEKQSDSTLVPGSNLVKSSLSLIKDSNGEWKVAKLNK